MYCQIVLKEKDDKIKSAFYSENFTLSKKYTLFDCFYLNSSYLVAHVSNGIHRHGFDGWRLFCLYGSHILSTIHDFEPRAAVRELSEWIANS